MVECDYCGEETYMPFRCNYCGGYFCSKHRLPELHNCSGAYQYSKPTNEYAEYRKRDEPFQPTGRTRMRRRSTLGFGDRETRDLGIALLLILAIPVIPNLRLFMRNPILALIVLLVFGSAFLLHEISHKIAAQRMGYWAEFRLNQTGLFLTILSLFSPFKIIAPGAVMLGGVMNWDDYGKIAFSGPLVNIAQAVFYLLLGLSPNSLLRGVSSFGMLVNSSLALFNLIPFGVFDGRKIMNWNKSMWAAGFITALLIYIYVSV